jgi:hypothetical protein
MVSSLQLPLPQHLLNFSSSFILGCAMFHADTIDYFSFVSPNSSAGDPNQHKIPKKEDSSSNTKTKPRKKTKTNSPQRQKTKPAKEIGQAGEKQGTARPPLAPLATLTPLSSDVMLNAFVEAFHKYAKGSPGTKLFLDFYAGAGKVAARASTFYGLQGVPLDYLTEPAFDLHVPGVVPFLKEQVESGRVAAAHLATECTSWSRARHGKPGSGTPERLRDYGDCLLLWEVVF